MKLELKSLSKSFLQGEQKLTILDSLELQLAEGEVVAVIGESGSGKSTLLSLVAGFEPPDAGDLRWNQNSSLRWSEQEWADFRKKHLGFVFQNYYLIPYLTALENAALPLRLLNDPACEEKAREALSELGLKHRLDHLPSQMSGGECQRVGIARALIHKPELVLADEPTGSLDSKTGEQVLGSLFTLLKQRRQTAMIVTHSREVAERCDRILTLRQGRLWPS